MSLQDQAVKYYNEFVKDVSKIDQLKKIEKQTGVPAHYIALGGIGAVAFAIFFNFAADFITDVLGFLYPAYASFKALETKGEDDDKKWLTYWVVYAFFNIIETFADIILSWLPFYFVIKVAVLFYLVSDKFNGSVFIYNNFLKQFFIKNEAFIDKEVAEFEKGAAKIQKQAAHAVVDASINASNNGDEKKEN